MRLIPLLLGLALALPAAAERFDLVLANGRVMDPETGLDAPRNVGIRESRIARISAEALSGTRRIDVKGLVVAPGFVDLHQHAQDPASSRLKAFDGVTTGLEMEIGVPDVVSFLSRKQGTSLINYGTTASHPAARAFAFGTPLAEPVLVAPSGPATNTAATPEIRTRIAERLGRELDAGALGIGMGIQYTPGATRQEVIDTFRLAAARNVPVFTHVRSFGRIEPGSSIESVSEVIGSAAVTGAALQIVHINSSCVQDGLECVALVAGARARGLDITTEAYPYTAGMTLINSALFNPGWREKLGIDYDALMLPDTGERLTKARFEALHASPAFQPVIMFANTQEMVDKVIAEPLVMIASDGLDGHPRNAGTFTKILARHVRELGSLTLMDALRKMSLMPAQRIEKSTPAARRLGRLQEGADADLIVFDPATVGDRASFQKPREPSVGMRYVLVGGTPVIDDGAFVEGVFPGRAIRR
ncbi:MAG: amidohydrolase family protein [Gammaproteobacteria bacterium]